jgi:S1-C subfamily serine protease
LRLGDRILAVNDIRVDRIVELDEALQAPEVGETVALLVRRGTITTFVPVSSPRAKTVSPH